MSASPAEFRHGLDLAFADRVTGGPEHFAIAADGAAMEIEVEVGPPRIIALLRLPTLRVRIRFTAGTPAQQAALLAHMDRAMQRGGG